MSLREVSARQLFLQIQKKNDVLKVHALSCALAHFLERLQ